MAVVTVVDDNAQLAATAALRITTLVEQAVAARNRAVLCLTGGRTPEPLYQLLADEREPWRARIDWSRLHVFWGDERHVPPDHPDSNYGMASRALLSRVPIPSAHIHRMHGEYPDARAAARAYEAGLMPFDVMLLGVGEDAHIASIFPGSALLHVPVTAVGAGPDGPPLVAAVWVEKLHTWRITVTPAAVLESRAILVMAAGPAKAAAIQAALTLPEDIATWPAQLLRRAGDRVEWIVDRAAATSSAADWRKISGGAAAPPRGEPRAQ